MAARDESWRLPLVPSCKHIDPRGAPLQAPVQSGLNLQDGAPPREPSGPTLRLHPHAHHLWNHLAVAIHAHAAARTVAQRLRAAHGAGHAGLVQDALTAHPAAEGDLLAGTL